MTKINFYDLDKSIRDKQCHEWLRSRLILSDLSRFNIKQPLSDIASASIEYGLTENYLISLSTIADTYIYQYAFTTKAFTEFSTISG